MRVEIAADVLDAGSVDPLALLGVVQLCRDTRRHFLVGPQKAFESWCKQLPRAIGDTVRHVVKQGVLQNPGRAKATPCIKVVAGESRWKAEGGPALRPLDAVRLLQAPLRLLVENGRNDGAFLRRVAVRRQHEAFDLALRMGWVVFEHAGGLQEMGETIDEISNLDHGDAASWVRWLRLWVMFDRDAHPDDRGKPSKESEDVLARVRTLQSITGQPWPGYQRLSRRAIENYLPKKGLDGFVRRPHGDSRRRQAAHEAFFHEEMNHGEDLLRASFHMARGFCADGQPIDPMYATLSPGKVIDLSRGFGPDVKKLWAEQSSIRPEWIEHGLHERIRKELGGIVGDVLTRI